MPGLSDIPPGFGGIVCLIGPAPPSRRSPQSRPGEERAFVIQYAAGDPVDGLVLTPVNLLALQKNVNLLVEQAKEAGFITPEHERQSAQLPVETDPSKIDVAAGRKITGW